MGNLTGDEMLVNEIKAGNALAFEAMVIKYQPKLLSSLIAYTKSHDQAEELCQKTCLLYTSPSPRDVEESRMPSSA